MSGAAGPPAGRVLLVEDAATASPAARAMLGELGYAVVGPAGSLPQALALLAPGLDAAVLEASLDGGRGQAIAEALAERGIPFLFAASGVPLGIGAAHAAPSALGQPAGRALLGEALAALLAARRRRPPPQRPPPMAWDADRLRVAADAAGVALWCWDLEADAVSMDQRSQDLWGIGEPTSRFADLAARIHPEDLGRFEAALAGTGGAPGGYEVEFRIGAGQAARWVSARGRGEGPGAARRLAFGVFLDVTARKEAEEARQMIADEMGHRVKNLFSVAAALALISERSCSTAGEMSSDLRLRLEALSRAHGLVRPDGAAPARAASLGELLAVLLAPYAGGGGARDRVQVRVPEMPVCEASATTLALVVHELATNSVKYGSLSAAGGTLAVSCDADGDAAVITWRESGGPAVTPPGGRAGFGSRLVASAVAGQLGGSIAFAWPPEGAVAVLRASRARLRGGPPGALAGAAGGG